jgi:hypothetical protein
MKQRIWFPAFAGMTIYICSLVPANVFAALGEGALGENTSGSVNAFLQSIQNWLLGLVGGLAILFIVYGGFLYMTSGGNKERVETAKKTLTYAIGGLLLVILAGVIFEILTGDFLPSLFGNGVLS